MQYNDYKDPRNKDQILNKLKSAKTLKDIEVLVKKTFPTWIIGFIDDYSDDYSMFKKNWVKICGELKTKPTQIMVVEQLFEGKEFSLLNIFADTYTRVGFNVKRIVEIMPCKVCGKALLRQPVYQLLKDKDCKDIPNKWSDVCSKCV